MVFRRLKTYFAKEDWFDAFVNLFIVVFGVYIGFQLDSWSDERWKDSESALFTEQLTSDLKVEYWNYQLETQYYMQVQKNAEYTLQALASAAPGSDEQILISAYRATQYAVGERRRDTYDELVATGSFELIRNPELRDAASKVYTTKLFDNMARSGLASKYREAFRMAVPIDVQRTLLAQCGDAVVATGDFEDLKHMLDYDCKTELSSEQISKAASMLRAHPELIPFLRLRITELDFNVSNLTSGNRDVQESLKRVAGDP